MLAAESPASFVAWDLLALGDEDLRVVPAGRAPRRRSRPLGGVEPPVHLTPGDARPRPRRGLVRPVRGRRPGRGRREAPRGDLPARQARDAQDQARAHRGLRGGRLPLAQERARDPRRQRCCSACSTTTGRLHHVGITSSFTWERREALVAELAPLREGALDGHPWAEWAEWAGYGTDGSGQRLPGATSRWNRGKDLSWEPLRAERVAEVGYDHLQGDRFRHATTFKRWRPDKPPAECRYDQLETTVPYELERIFGAG